ncbi:MAG TPA: hypothetical protein VE643_05575 [Nitrososphaeraceae archaeon]|nr:hypothetical protein [Nitrososphaeraceae archaeon]
MLTTKKTAYIDLYARSKHEQLKTLEPKRICLGEVANSGFFACQENVSIPNTTTSSFSAEQKCKIALYNNKKFH